MATKRDKLLHAPRILTPEQLNAVDLLARGATDAAVAAAVGVHRVTVTKWRRSPSFVAALNARRAELYTRVTDAFRDLLPRALAAVGDALADPDTERRTEAAFRLLALAKLPLAPTGETDHRAVVDIELAKRKAIETNRHEELVAKMDGTKTYEERFRQAFAEMEDEANAADNIHCDAK